MTMYWCTISTTFVKNKSKYLISIKKESHPYALLTGWYVRNKPFTLVHNTTSWNSKIMHLFVKSDSRKKMTHSWAYIKPNQSLFRLKSLFFGNISYKVMQRAEVLDVIPSYSIIYSYRQNVIFGRLIFGGKTTEVRRASDYRGRQKENTTILGLIENSCSKQNLRTLFLLSLFITLFFIVAKLLLLMFLNNSFVATNMVSTRKKKHRKKAIQPIKRILNWIPFCSYCQWKRGWKWSCRDLDQWFYQYLWQINNRLEK